MDDKKFFLVFFKKKISHFTKAFKDYRKLLNKGILIEFFIVLGFGSSKL